MAVLPDNLQLPIPIPVLSTLITYFGTVQFEEAMQHENVKLLLAEEQHPEFDLVIVENFATEAFYSFGEYFNAPIIAVSTTLNTNWLNQAIGNVEPWSYVANQFLRGSTRMGFIERFNNVVFNLFEHALIRVYSRPAQNALIRKYFPDNKKDLQEILRNDVCLGFVNTHYTISSPRPYVPNMIEIGGINIDRKVDKLPADFQQFLDSATEGVIVFSMGSIFQASNLDDEQRSAFISSFSKLKQKVIWRYNLPDANSLPDNIMAREWLPQKEILAHPNIKLFITHGGMLGTTEGFYHGVPMIGIPIFGDQPVNVARNVERGFAVSLDRGNLTEVSVSWAIREILDNPKYSESVKALSAAYHDQPMTPQATVVFWSEFVIKHKCARFMRNAGLTMGIVAYNNLDVWLLLIVLSLGLTWSICIAIRKRCLKKERKELKRKAL